MKFAAAVSLAILLVGEFAHADAKRQTLDIEIPGERTLTNKLVLGSSLGVGLALSGLGLYYNLESRDAADAVSADHFSGKAWTSEEVALVDRAASTRTKAIVFYAAGSAVVIGTIVGFILTAPKSEHTVIRTGMAVVPTEGGALAAGMWRF